MPMPGVDRAMHIRLRRLRMGAASYVMFLIPLVISVERGWTGFGYGGLVAFCAAALLVNAGFWIAIRSGWSLRFPDPALTFSQIAVSAAMALVMMRYAGQIRGVLLMLFFSAFFFGVFGLSTRQLLALTAGVLGGYALLVVVPEWQGGGAGSDGLALELLRFVTLAMLLVWMSLIGGYVAGLRGRLVEANTRLRALASHDELTGVYNRRHLMEILAREKERADRYHHPFSVCLIDIDRFKAINDRHGHEAGDDVLRQFAQRLREHSRRIDWVGREDERDEASAFGRYGGEEFLLVLPHASAEGAARCMQRIHAVLRATPFQTGAGPVPVTCSAGVACYRPGEPLAALLRRADAALYQAKQRGRDRSELESG